MDGNITITEYKKFPPLRTTPPKLTLEEIIRQIFPPKITVWDMIRQALHLTS